MIAFLIAVVVIVAVGATYLAYRNRPEHSIESGITSFRREMRALAPPGERGPEPTDTPTGHPTGSPTDQPTGQPTGQPVTEPPTDRDDDPAPGAG